MHGAIASASEHDVVMHQSRGHMEPTCTNENTEMQGADSGSWARSTTIPESPSLGVNTDETDVAPCTRRKYIEFTQTPTTSPSGVATGRRLGSVALRALVDSVVHVCVCIHKRSLGTCVVCHEAKDPSPSDCLQIPTRVQFRNCVCMQLNFPHRHHHQEQRSISATHSAANTETARSMWD